jgi:CBS domain-containing protein
MTQALKQRARDFPGVVTCEPGDSLGAIFSLIKARRVHRLVVVQGRNDPEPGKLVGVISLSDVMKTVIVSAELLLARERELIIRATISSSADQVSVRNSLIKLFGTRLRRLLHRQRRACQRSLWGDSRLIRCHEHPLFAAKRKWAPGGLAPESFANICIMISRWEKEGKTAE